jgi:hypothetical protein
MRRMCNEAVQLVDRVFPNVPVRQWVLSLPWELRGLAATKAKVLGAMDKIFAEEITRSTKQRAGIDGAETGSVACPQRFGGALNVHPHLHTLCVDGVFEKTDDGGVRFHEAQPPSKDDVSEVAQRVRDRAGPASPRRSMRVRSSRWRAARSSRSRRVRLRRTNRRTTTSIVVSGASRRRATGSTCTARSAPRPTMMKAANVSCATAPGRRSRSPGSRCCAMAGSGTA